MKLSIKKRITLFIVVIPFPYIAHLIGTKEFYQFIYSFFLYIFFLLGLILSVAGGTPE